MEEKRNVKYFTPYPEVVAQRCSVKKMFLTISQNSLRTATLLKKETGTDVFPVNFEKFLRATFFYRTPPVTVSTYLFLSCRTR